MALLQKLALGAACPLSGAKNGRRTGMKLNIAAIDVVKVNEAQPLFTL